MRQKRRAPDKLPVLVAAHREALTQARAPGSALAPRWCWRASRWAAAWGATWRWSWPPQGNPPAALICFGYPLRAAGSGALRDEVLRQLTDPGAVPAGQPRPAVPAARLWRPSAARWAPRTTCSWSKAAITRWPSGRKQPAPGEPHPGRVGRRGCSKPRAGFLTGARAVGRAGDRVTAARRRAQHRARRRQRPVAPLPAGDLPDPIQPGDGRAGSPAQRPHPRLRGSAARLRLGAGDLRPAGDRLAARAGRRCRRRWPPRARRAGDPAHVDRRPQRKVKIPVFYDPRWRPIWCRWPRRRGCRSSELVEQHSAPLYRCHLIGFRPGFPFLGGLPPGLATPRLATPAPARARRVGGHRRAADRRLPGRRPRRLAHRRPHAAGHVRSPAPRGLACCAPAIASGSSPIDRQHFLELGGQLEPGR